MSNYFNSQWRLPNEENKNKQSNYSMYFNSGDYIDAGATPIVTGVFTFSLWIKRSSTSSGAASQVIIGKDGQSSNRVFNVFMSLSGSIGFWVSDTGTYSSTYRINTSTLINDTNWHNLIVINNGNNNNNQVFIDGTEASYVDQGTGRTTLYNTTGIATSIGSSANSPTVYPFNGFIDGVAIFDYAISQSQITTLYGSSSTGIGNPMSLSPKPVAYYPLGDQDVYNGADYLVPNASLQDFVFSFISSQEINCGNNSTLQMGTVFTMSCWINTTSTSRGSIMGTFVSEGYYIDIMPSGTVQGGYHSTGSHFLRPSSSTVNDGKWHHICYVISGTATDGSDLDVYVDGQLNNGSFTSSGTPSGAATTNPFKINLSGYAGRYTGKTSNVQVFNSALSSTDVETLYNNGSPLTSMSGFTSLQGWWKLNASATFDGSNWSIPDDSSNSNTGTSSGMTQANLVQSDLSFTSGYSPYALDFDSASSDYIDCGNDSSLNVSTSNHSFSFWLKTTTTSNEVIAQKGNGDELDTQTRPIGSGNVAISWAGFNGYDGTTVINDGNWHNIIFIANGSVSYIYVDGNLDVTGGNKIQSSSNSDSFYIGSRAGLYGFNGSLSNLSIWNTALTSAQVTELYSEGVPSNLNNHSAYSNLISWWQLGSNSSFNTNWTVLDEKGSNNGTSVNMDEVDIVDGVNTYGGGTSSGMGGDEVIGDAPYSSSNSLSVNMDVLDRVTDTPS